MAKNSSWPVTGLGNKGPLKVLNGTKLMLDDHGNNLDSFRISLESFRSFRSFRGPLFHKPVTGQELFFAISYSKPALIGNQLGRVFCKKDKINSISSDLLGWEFDLVLFWRKPSTVGLRQISGCPIIDGPRGMYLFRLDRPGINDWESSSRVKWKNQMDQPTDTLFESCNSAKILKEYIPRNLTIEFLGKK